MIAKKLRGRLSWRPLLIYVYFENEPGRANRRLSCSAKMRREGLQAKLERQGQR
jgi:hypothetical protein